MAPGWPYDNAACVTNTKNTVQTTYAARGVDRGLRVRRSVLSKVQSANANSIVLTRTFYKNTNRIRVASHSILGKPTERETCKVQGTKPYPVHLQNPFGYVFRPALSKRDNAP